MKYLGTTFFKRNNSFTILGQAQDGSLWQINIHSDGVSTGSGGCNCCSHPRLVEELARQGVKFGEAIRDEKLTPPPEEWMSLRKEHDENPRLYTYEE